MKLRYRLLIAFLFVAILSVGIAGFYSIQRSRSALKEELFRHLNSVAEMKRQQVQDYFDDIFQRAQVFSDMWFTKSLVKEFGVEFALISNKYVTLDNNKSLAVTKFGDYLHDSLSDTVSQLPSYFIKYQYLYKKYNTDLDKYLSRTPFSDLYFVSESGHVVFCSSSNALLGTLPLNNNQLSNEFKKALKQVQESSKPEIAFSDFQPFYLKGGIPVAFVFQSVWQDGKKIGVVFFEISNAKLTEILTFNGSWEDCGLMKTGESFIIGPHLFMRSESRLFVQNPDSLLLHLKEMGYPNSTIDSIKKHQSTVLNLRVLTEASMGAIRGDNFQGSYIDYLNKQVIGCAKPLNILGNKLGIVVKLDEDEAFARINAVEEFLLSVFLGTILLVVLVAVALSVHITQPLTILSKKAKEISDGNFDPMQSITRRDEIGALAGSFKEMQQKIGGLINDLISSRKSIEEKQQAIIDSVNYARKIQEGILTSTEYLNEILPEWFVYFNPRDIVSGDFYWAQRITLENGKNSEAVFLAVCDSTGHGVPGAFMSLLNVNLIKEAILERKLVQPADIFNYVRDALSLTFPSDDYKDGMDGVLLLIEENGKKITYSAAYNSPILIRNGEPIVLEADRMPIGKGYKRGEFNNYSIDIQKGDIIYLLSDGYVDQFGGERDKKYKIKPFLAFLQTIAHLPLEGQKEELKFEFEKWRGEASQTDDVVVFGLKF